MSTPKSFYNHFPSQLCELNPDIHPGKMMSADGLKFNGKVFLFFYKDDYMVFKLEQKKAHRSGLNNTTTF